MTITDALPWILRGAGAVIAILWTIVLLRLRGGRPFEGRDRVLVITVVSIVVGIAVFAASFIPVK